MISIIFTPLCHYLIQTNNNTLEKCQLFFLLKTKLNESVRKKFNNMLIMLSNQLKWSV